MRRYLMGKDINGKELGKGITQRNDGRYNARVTINGRLIYMIIICHC